MSRRKTDISWSQLLQAHKKGFSTPLSPCTGVFTEWAVSGHGGMHTLGKESNSTKQGFRVYEELVVRHLPTQLWIKDLCN